MMDQPHGYAVLLHRGIGISILQLKNNLPGMLESIAFIHSHSFARLSHRILIHQFDDRSLCR